MSNQPLLPLEKNEAAPTALDRDMSVISVSGTLALNWQLRLLMPGALLLRLATVAPFIESGDGLYFVRGVTRYSVLELRPHWPGYPVYIWLGKLLSGLVSNPVLALHVLAVIAATACLWPLALLAGEFAFAITGSLAQAHQATLIAGVLWALLPLSWLTASQIDSDTVALFLALLILWLCWRSLSASTSVARYLMSAVLCGGLLLGVRLAYYPLLAPLIFTVWYCRRKTSAETGIKLWKLGLAFGVPVVGWFSWQLAVEGAAYFQAAAIHLSGHYSEWGGSVLTDAQPLSRFLRWCQTIWVYGLGGWWSDAPLTRLPASFIIVGGLMAGAWQLRRTRHQPALILLACWAIPYTGWVLVSQDLSIGRYALPLVALICLVIGLGVANFKRYWHYSMLVIIASALLLVSVPLALETNRAPAAAQLADYVKNQFEPAQTRLIISANVPRAAFVPLFLYENAPGFTVIVSESENETRETAARLTQLGAQIYLVTLAQDLPAGWVVTARFRQAQFSDSAADIGNFRELWLLSPATSR